MEQQKISLEEKTSEIFLGDLDSISITEIHDVPTSNIEFNRKNSFKHSFMASWIAKSIVLTYSLGLLGCFAMVPIALIYSSDNETVTRERIEIAFELFKTFSSIMSGPLGFTLGFYFRESNRYE